MMLAEVPAGSMTVIDTARNRSRRGAGKPRHHGLAGPQRLLRHCDEPATSAGNRNENGRHDTARSNSTPATR